MAGQPGASSKTRCLLRSRLHAWRGGLRRTKKLTMTSRRNVHFDMQRAGARRPSVENAH